MPEKQKVIVIVGPTSSGKSDLAVEIAREVNGEVISADSRQVYRGLDIGTGKISKREMRGVKHHLLDVASPLRTFTAAEFADMAREAIADIASRGKVPIIAGGTGFYIDVVVGKVSLPLVFPNPRIRKMLEEKSEDELFQMLQEKDPARAKTIEQHNKRRLVRALEIIESLGSVPVKEADQPYNVLWIGIAPPKKELEERIHTRLLARMKKGMAAEARALFKRGVTYKRMHELGLEYRYLAMFVKDEITKEEMIEELSAKIRQYARRQMTYWRKNRNIKWFKSPDPAKVLKHVKEFLK